MRRPKRAKLLIGGMILDRFGAWYPATRMPVVGVKHSGYGRECADFGIRQFVNAKWVQVKAWLWFLNTLFPSKPRRVARGFFETPE
jgi:acyl-CoA reductase-like NAD-dependent aldehyde dehydrogenase